MTTITIPREMLERAIAALERSDQQTGHQSLEIARQLQEARRNSIAELRSALSASGELPPAPSRHPKQKPLSEAHIDLIANDGMRNAIGGIYATRVYEFARAIEAAHGIAAASKGSA